MTLFGAGRADWLAPGCDAVRRALGEYLDGELYPPSRRAISAHLSCCAQCLEQAVGAVRFEKALAVSLSAVPPGSAAFWARCRAQLGDAPVAGPDPTAPAPSPPGRP